MFYRHNFLVLKRGLGGTGWGVGGGWGGGKKPTFRGGGGTGGDEEGFNSVGK